MLNVIQQKLKDVQQDSTVSNLVMRKASELYQNGQCQMLTRGKYQYKFSIDDEYNDFTLTIQLTDHDISTKCNCKSSSPHCQHAIVGLLELKDFFKNETPHMAQEGKQYTREGMIQRVLNERKDKALKDNFKIQFSDNKYGEHEVINQKGVKYYVTFRDIENEKGYCCCPDYQTNKLGICKHLMAAFSAVQNKKTFKSRNQNYPFVEIFLDPLSNYQISWFYPNPLPSNIGPLIKRYFGDNNVLPPEKNGDMLSFIEEAQEFKKINIRPEVHTAVESFFEDRMIARITKNVDLDFSILKCDLFEYQKEGISFAALKKNAIIADEMGLGKTVQSIGSAIFKKELFGFEQTLVICPASLKDQWKREIERFSQESATIIEGPPDKRQHIYENELDYFLIANYETVMRDLPILKKNPPDLIILDEAQRIKNYETMTANAVKQIPKKHGLVITGTPIENRLVDLYSIMEFLDPKILSPLWEFSYQHCYFDMDKKNKIHGYYNLQQLKNRLKPVLIRREKQAVLKQLPHVSHIDIPIPMHRRQAEIHVSYAKAVARIIKKKYMTRYDMQRLMLLLAKMRMVCDSTHLVEDGPPCSPKMDELKQVLLDKLDIHNSTHKVVIFSEWVRMNQMIGRMLRDQNIGYVELNGKVPVANRPRLIKEFEDNPDCKVFLSTEAGGTGLNLQVADSVINFELPWNPAKKNQRIGRIDRLGQKRDHLTVVSFITQNSIETRIASGLLLKQELFNSVLSPDSELDEVDFSSKNRSQFLKELENAIQGFTELPEDLETPEKTKDDVTEEIDENILPDLSEEEISEEVEAEVLKKEEKDTSSALMELPQTESKDSDQPVKDSEQTVKEPPDSSPPRNSPEQLESVMNQGMSFLSGLMQMATGQSIGMSDKAIEVNRETGEVVMRFKMPVGPGQ
ncbi:protein containing SNF2-related protein [Candidatus Magnetomorum sp. HK-1]|nr:protein containing SNF2-related protein [Candidatus Magnetomorum sp. HK-1]